MSKPYEERRAYATARKLWPEVEIVSASTPMSFKEYVEAIGDVRLVVDMLVGAQQRLLVYPRERFMISMDVPAEVTAAYERLHVAGFTSRLIRAAVGRSTGKQFPVLIKAHARRGRAPCGGAAAPQAARNVLRGRR